MRGSCNYKNKNKNHKRSTRGEGRGFKIINTAQDRAQQRCAQSTGTKTEWAVRSRTKGKGGGGESAVKQKMTTCTAQGTSQCGEDAMARTVQRDTHRHGKKNSRALLRPKHTGWGRKGAISLEWGGSERKCVCTCDAQQRPTLENDMQNTEMHTHTRTRASQLKNNEIADHIKEGH